MKTIILFTLIFGPAFKGSTQNLVKDYKKVADKSLLLYFDSSTVPKIECNLFSTTDQDGTDRYFYNEYKNKRLAFSSITFTYSLFDRNLNDDIVFYVSVDKNFQVEHDSSIFKRVPPCIRANRPCNFISADKAKQIAITDSIRYPGNLSSQLEKNRLDKDYYWIITGHEPSNRPRTNKSKIIRHAGVVYTSQERFINAKTGQIISDSQFEHDWH